MDSEFLDRIQKLQLTTEEDEAITIRPVRRKEILEEYSLSLIGKFLTTRSINMRAAKNLLRSTWKMGDDLKVVEVGDGLLQFKFAMESQLNWVWNNGPWCFDNQILALRRWEKGMTVRMVNFTHLPMWVQVWGLPFDLTTEEAGQDIGQGLGRVIEVDCKAIKTDQARFLRIRVKVPLDRPLRRGCPIVSPEGDEAKVAFRYERLVGWCFACGRIGHEMKECESANDMDKSSRPYGEWLKAGTRLKPEMPRNKQGSPERFRREPNTATEPVTQPVNLTDTCSTDRESTEKPETAQPSPTRTLPHLMQSITPLFSPYTLPADPIFTETNITSNQNISNMETDHHEGTLYCVPVNYGKTNDTVTLPSATPSTPAEDSRGKLKATWKKIERPKKPPSKKPSATSLCTSPVGKKRHSSHANSHDGQVDEAKNKRFKGEAGTTHSNVQTVEAVVQPRRSQ